MMLWPLVKQHMRHVASAAIITLHTSACGSDSTVGVDMGGGGLPRRQTTLSGLTGRID